MVYLSIPNRWPEAKNSSFFRGEEGTPLEERVQSDDDDDIDGGCKLGEGEGWKGFRMVRSGRGWVGVA